MPTGIPGTGVVFLIVFPGTNSACFADLAIPLVHLLLRDQSTFFFFLRGFVLGF